MEHDTYAADDPNRGAMVACVCGWRKWLEDAPVEGMARIDWLLDQKDLHRKEFEVPVLDASEVTWTPVNPKNLRGYPW